MIFLFKPGKNKELSEKQTQTVKGGILKELTDDKQAGLFCSH